MQYIRKRTPIGTERSQISYRNVSGAAFPTNENLITSTSFFLKLFLVETFSIILSFFFFLLFLECRVCTCLHRISDPDSRTVSPRSPLSPLGIIQLIILVAASCTLYGSVFLGSKLQTPGFMLQVSCPSGCSLTLTSPTKKKFNRRRTRRGSYHNSY